MILNKIISQKKKMVEKEKFDIPLDILFSQIKGNEQIRDFRNSITNKGDLSIIAEVKKASPSKGVIREVFKPVEIADMFIESKIEAISVLTEEHYFQGSNQYLIQIREITNIPILRKDFIIDAYQIFQSKVLGADAILLVVAVLDVKKLHQFQNIAKDIGLQCLVEVHDKEELEIALEVGADIIGINNRNLNTFETTLETTATLFGKIPKEKTIISESGIHTRADMKYLEEIGVDGVLIGESLMRVESIGSKIQELRG